MRQDERAELTPQDRELVATIRDSLPAPELTAVERGRFDARLFARLERPASGWIGGLAWLPAVAATLLLTLSPMGDPEVIDWLAPLVEAQTVIDPATQSWAEASPVTLRDAWTEPDPEADLEAILPDDYLALALWLDTTNDESARGGANQPQP